MKICTTCKVPKELNEFHKHLKGQFGRHPKCKVCRRAWHKQYFQRERTKILRRQASKRYDRKGASLRRLYGITRKVFNEKVTQQQSRCAICQDKKNLCVDHDHRTKQVRDLLCTTCNLGLGAFAENPQLLQAAISYLMKWRKE